MPQKIPGPLAHRIPMLQRMSHLGREQALRSILPKRPWCCAGLPQGQSTPGLHRPCRSTNGQSHWPRQHRRAPRARALPLNPLGIPQEHRLVGPGSHASNPLELTWGLSPSFRRAHASRQQMFRAVSIRSLAGARYASCSSANGHSWTTGKSSFRNRLEPLSAIVGMLQSSSGCSILFPTPVGARNAKLS
jgi:hypothetical protein